jgi:NAD(P)-dependent dehydrogenase (short-subunit alcohol dehydrogenase family)
LKQAPDSEVYPFDLTGRGIGVTGGGGHLGAEVAVTLAALGPIVVVCGRTESTLAAAVKAAEDRHFSGYLVAERADISQDDQIGGILDRLELEAGGVDGWVNNAYAGGSGRYSIPLDGKTKS